MKQVFSLFIVLLFHQCILAQGGTIFQLGNEEKWEILGTKEVGFKADFDAIVLTAGNDKIRKIKFQVKDSPIDMIKIEISYDVGSSDEIEMKGRIADGGESRPIDIRGIGRKKIRKVTFWYDTKGFNGKATVTILGME